MYKKIIITFLLVFSAFLGLGRVSAAVSDWALNMTKEEIDNYDLQNYIDDMIEYNKSKIDFDIYKNYFAVFRVHIPGLFL